MAVLPEGSRLNSALGSGAGKSYPMVSASEADVIEKAARGGYDEQLSDLFDKLRLNNRQVSKRILNAALHATVDGCSATVNLERHVNCLHTLLANEASVNSEINMKTILMIASAKGYIELVREIINMEANVN